jgi:3-oxoadipate enol-lactonase
MERIRIGDIHLSVEIRGAGPALLLVHGFPLDHQMWRHQIDAFSVTCRVIAPDLRGFGQSDATPGIVTMQQYADDLAALLDALSITEPVTFCGLSMGGYIAWQFVERHARRAGKLVLCDTRAVADTSSAAQTRLDTAQQVLADGPQALVESMTPKLFAPATLENQKDLVHGIQQVMRSTSREGIAAALRGMAKRPDVTGRLAEIRIPALVVCGSADAIAPPSEMRGIAAAMPQAEFVEITAAGHMAPLENPAAFNSALAQFLK